jgi:outer membrane lipopolysaccharide assembly protein LptE/RlpB
VRTSLCALLAAVSLGGCAGYHIGNVKPQYLKDIHSLSIPTFHNKTYIPRAEILVTNTVIKQFQQDGTFRIANEDNADATLEATIVSVGRTPARSVRGNVLATTEFNLTVRVSYRLVGRDGKVLAGPIVVSGATSFFVGTDVTTDERQALPLAAEDLAVDLVSQLSEGW